MLKAKLCIILCFVAQTIFAQHWEQLQKQIAPDRNENDWFGYSVSIHNNFAAVGAPHHSFNSENTTPILQSGAVYIYKYSQTNQWEFYQKVVPINRHQNASFGHSVSIHNNYLLVGAPNEFTDSDNENVLDKAGAAYMFRLDQLGYWKQIHKWTATERNTEDSFGYSVCIDQNIAAIGAIYEDEDQLDANTLNNSGAAYVYHLDYLTNKWSFEQKITHNDRSSSDLFGSSIDIHSGTIVVGARHKDIELGILPEVVGAGATYIFGKLNDGKWIEKQKIFAPIPGNKDLFGCSVALYGNHIVVGAENCKTDADNSNEYDDAGAAYIFALSNGEWVYRQKIVSKNRGHFNFFGNVVDINADYIFVGSKKENILLDSGQLLIDPGTVYVFVQNDQEHWFQIQEIYPEERHENSYFGTSLALDDQKVFIGAPEEVLDENESNPIEDSGAIYYFYTPNVAHIFTELDICEGSSVILEGEPQTEAGTYIDFLTEVDDQYYYTITELHVTDLPNPTINLNENILQSEDNFVSYQWYFNGNLIESATNSSYIPQQEGLYTVVVSDETGCENTSLPYHVLSLDLTEEILLYSYPNPAEEQISITHTNWTGTVSLYQMNGQLISKQRLSDTGKTTIQLDDALFGLYYLQATDTKGKSYQQKIFIK